MEALGINFGYLIVQILNFLIMFVVLKAWVYEPVLNLLEDRRETIARGVEDARVAAEARENAEEDAERIVQEAQDEATEIVREASQRAESIAEDNKSEAEKEAEEARKEALEGVEEQRVRILGELRGQVASLAIAATQKLVGDALDEQRQHQLIQEFFAGVESGEVVVLKDASISGASAEVTSALPLTEEEQDAVKADVLSKFGGQATVTFRVDPSILGGLVIRVGDKVLDGSVSGQLEAMRGRLS